MPFITGLRNWPDEVPWVLLIDETSQKTGDELVVQGGSWGGIVKKSNDTKSLGPFLSWKD